VLVIAGTAYDGDGRSGRSQRARAAAAPRLVINVSRGSLLDEQALLELIDLRRLRGAALDVFAVEPLPAEHRSGGMPACW